MRIKNLSLLIVSLLYSVLTYGQDHFRDAVIVESTDLKHQKATGKCWSFASTSLLEAEAIRLNYDIPELSSFYFVYHNYLQKSEDYLRKRTEKKILWGDLTFSVLEIFEKYGCVPEEIYDGALGSLTTQKEMMQRWKDEDKMNALIQSKLDSALEVGMEIVESLDMIRDILNKEIGEAPSEFQYNNQVFTPKTYAQKFIPLDAAEYVELTSYTHLPFYEKSALDIPANWRKKEYLNLPIEDFIATVFEALRNGYTLAWDGDIGNDGGFKESGIVKVKGEYEDEKIIKQQHRQSAFERKTTTDDHNMHIVGFAKDKKGNNFFILKNTWGKNRGKNGYWYLSENYFRLRTISVTVNKHAIPTKIRTKITL